MLLGQAHSPTKGEWALYSRLKLPDSLTELPIPYRFFRPLVGDIDVQSIVSCPIYC